MMELRDICYPILRVNDRGVLQVKNPRQIRVLPEVSFSKEALLETTIFLDEKCRKYVLKGIKKRRRSFHLKYWGGPHRMYVTDYEVNSLEQLSFEQAREYALKPVLRNRWYGQGGESREKFLERAMSYRSMREFIDCLCSYGTLWY